MRKFLTSFVLGTALIMLFITPVYAYTGWSAEGGKAVFYQEDRLVTNSWILYGENLYFAGADGQLSTSQTVNVSAAAAYGISSYVNGNIANVKYDIPLKQDAGDALSAAKYAYNVNDDYEAFKKLYPERVQAFNGDETGLYNYYISSYLGAPIDNRYLNALDGAVYGYYYHTHSYTQRYENNYDGTHTAYCGCGQWIIEECNTDIHHSASHRSCSKCGQKYKYKSKRDPKDNGED